MFRLLRYLSAIALFVLPMLLKAQEKNPVSLRYEKQRVNDSTVMLSFHASVKPGLRLYSLQQSKGFTLKIIIMFNFILTFAN